MMRYVLSQESGNKIQGEGLCIRAYISSRHESHSCLLPSGRFSIAKLPVHPRQDAPVRDDSSSTLGNRRGP